MDAPTEDLDLFRIARRQFDQAVPFVHPLKGWRGMAEMLFEPERVIKLSLPVMSPMTAGSTSGNAAKKLSSLTIRRRS
ncbi:MAG TPA: hypothetical protein EYP73_05225, partial [Acidimicrobiia bacterium]|nr:hypothetical protein [Acidimicrobiia bacterium]